MAFNIPFQPGEALRERAGTNCAHSFRFLRDEQNMVADSRFDGSLIQAMIKTRQCAIRIVVGKV